MSDILPIAGIFAMSALLCAVILRRVAARRVQARRARLKEHLDWVNPAAATGRRRGPSRR